LYNSGGLPEISVPNLKLNEKWVGKHEPTCPKPDTTGNIKPSIERLLWMEKKKNGLLTRRQALGAIATITAGAVLKPTWVLGAGPVNNKISFALIGDWGTGESGCAGIANQMVQAHLSSPFDFVIAAGDNIYPNGNGKLFGKNFESPFAALIKEQVKFYAVLGNHDVREGRQDQCQYPLFNMGGSCYYSLKKGDGLAEFFMIDSTDLGLNQAGWLEEALRTSTARWKIAVFHHPIYSSAKSHGSDMKLRKILEPMLTRYGVKAVFSGHDHIYERTKPQQGIHYFVSGAGGKVRRGDVELKSQIRAASFDEDNHYMQFEMDDREINFRAISRNGMVVDSGTIS
jgi:predicted MPP superfamily phosphohydrolase